MKNGAKTTGTDPRGMSLAYRLSGGMRGALRKIASMPIIIMLVVVWIVFILLSKNFLTGNNMVTLLVANAYFIAAAIGEAFVLMTGGIDLSIAHNVTCSSLVSAVIMTSYQFSTGATIIIGLFTCIAVGLLIGLINGISIGRFGMNPFIVTLATQLMARGVGYVLSGGHSIPGTPDELTKMSYAYGIRFSDQFTLPWIIIILIVLFIAFAILMDQTRWGRNVKLVGANMQSARYVGINVRYVTGSVYVVAGLLAGIGGFLSMMCLGTADVKVGDPLLMPVIGSVILGGVSMTGGEGNMIKAGLGVLMFATIINGMTFFNATIAAQQLIMGAIFIIGMAALSRLNRRA